MRKSRFVSIGQFVKNSTSKLNIIVIEKKLHHTDYLFLDVAGCIFVFTINNKLRIVSKNNIYIVHDSFLYWKKHYGLFLFEIFSASPAELWYKGCPIQSFDKINNKKDGNLKWSRSTLNYLLVPWYNVCNIFFNSFQSCFDNCKYFNSDSACVHFHLDTKKEKWR